MTYRLFLQDEEKQQRNFFINSEGVKMAGKIIAVCGNAGSGKSTICASLAATFSEQNKIVIVYGTRIDYPSIQSFFNELVPEERSIKKLYEDISLNISVHIKDYLVQYKNTNIFLLTLPDNADVLTLAESKILPDEQQCKNIILSLKNVCDYLLIDCDTDISNHVSAWGQNYADIIIHLTKPTQQGLRFENAYQRYFEHIWRGQVINVVNADKNYIGIKDFTKALNKKLSFDVVISYDEQVELSENTGIPVIENYHRMKIFGSNFKSEFMELVKIIERSDVQYLNKENIDERGDLEDE